MKNLLMLSVLISSVMAAGGMGMPSFSDFDSNGDGKITQKELNDGRAKRHEQKAKEGRMLRNIQNAPSFAEFDTNGDGVISKEEFAAHQKARRGQ